MITRYFDGFFLYGFLAFDDEITSRSTRRSATPRARLPWVKSLWQRNLNKADRGGQALQRLATGAAVPRSSPMPACSTWRAIRWLFPSGMSLVTGVLEGLRLRSLPEDVRQRWLDRIYQAFVMLLERFRGRPSRIPRRTSTSCAMTA